LVDGGRGLPFFRSNKGKIFTDWIPYLADVAYQTLLLQELFPALVTPFLCLVDTSKSTDIETIFSRFGLKRSEPIPGHKFARPYVSFFGDVERLRLRPFLITIDASAELGELTPMVIENAERFAASLQGQLQKMQEPIGNARVPVLIKAA
jgi:hypothetical protein